MVIMNKTLKAILIILNVIMLGLAINWWYTNKEETEPLITIIGEIMTLLVILFEKNISRIKTKKVRKSKIGIDTVPGSNISTSDIQDSEIDIKNR